MENFAEKLGKLLGRLIAVLVSRGVISERDRLYIMDEMDYDEWTGDDDE